MREDASAPRFLALPRRFVDNSELQCRLVRRINCVEPRASHIEKPEEPNVKLRKDLTKFLDITIKDSDNKERDIEIIVHYYGLNGAEGTTLQETALQFDGFASRQRISQIIKENFKDVANSSDVPALAQIGRILDQNQFWRGQDLHSRLVESGLTSHVAEIQGYFKLLDDLDEQSGYDVYSPELTKARGRKNSNFKCDFAIDATIFPDLKRLLGRAKRAPGRTGIANLHGLDVWRDSEEEAIYLPFIETLIIDNPNAWSAHFDGQLWYLFEEYQNRLKNYNRKVFSIAEHCELAKLSETYENAIPRGSADTGFPPRSVISAYLRSAPECEIIDGDVYYHGPTSNLTQIESDAVGFLAKQPRTHYPRMRDALLAKGYNAPYVDKTVFYSSLIHVDKRDDRKNFVFSFVGASGVIAETQGEAKSKDPRYRKFRRQLMAITKTDRKEVQFQRVEQPILSSWLFEDKETEHCGICGQLFSVSALHAAHKKKRSLCTPNERRDPHIVMPMCVFGCDHLYENRLIRIEDGIVQACQSPPVDGPEKERIRQLVGRKIEDRWLEGPQSYFGPPNLGQGQ